ncbi:MAG: glutamate 5-kinase, partial [Desulfovibrionaceae bacterium]|nr:glutamate 5-kinase [Desulfovibrionaceae bacterium]
VSVRELRFGDNDCLAGLLVSLVEADLFINLTSSDGVLAANPQRDPDAPILPCIEAVGDLDLDDLCGGKTSVGTGGMYSKLLAARRAAQLGVPTLILPGRTPGIITRSMAQAAAASDDPASGVLPGTWVRPEIHPISRRKFWLAYQSDPAGTVFVDAGAAVALSEKGGSLLPGGVCGVEGNFRSGALVRIVTHDGAHLGVGLSNYTAEELRRIMGLKRHEVAAVLGDAHYPEVIHRDHMLLDAAV